MTCGPETRGRGLTVRRLSFHAPKHTCVTYHNQTVFLRLRNNDLPERDLKSETLAAARRETAKRCHRGVEAAHSQVPSSGGNTETADSAAPSHYVIKFTMFGHTDPLIR